MITLNELFSGIGSQKSAFDRLGIECNVVGISDIDKYANQSYMAIHGETRQYGDISKIDHLDYADLWTYSFPCQDLSVAGKQAGITENSRSGLLFQVERLLEKSVQDGTQPKYLLLENVKNLVGKKFKPDFDRWLNKLEELGYRNYWKVLNAKNYGVPQNRERVFVVSIRKDVDKSYKFPEPVKLEKRLKDVLEETVDDKYYLSDDKVQRFVKSIDISHTIRVGGRSSYDKKHCWDVVCCASRGRNSDNQSDRTTEQRLEFNKEGIINTIKTVEKDNYIAEPKITEMFNPYNKSQINDVAPTQTTSCGSETTSATVMIKYDNLRIRKLTPKECWRLMGFTDEEFELARASGVSNSQLYKQAGNSIVVDVLVAIFKNLFINKVEETEPELF